MLGKYKFTDSEMKELLSTITIIVDTRENQWNHIEDYFTKKKINYKINKLEFGDYSFMIPANHELCIPRDIYFTEKIVIERKADLIELIGNLCEDGGSRLESEFIRSRGAKFYLMIENDSYLKAVMGKYEISPGKVSKYKPQSLIARVMSFAFEYDLNVEWGIDPIASGNFILQTFRYYLRDQIKKGGLYDGEGEMPLPSLS